MRKRKCAEGNAFQKKRKKKILPIALATSFMLISIYGYNQDGTAGIEEANNKVRGYFDVGCNLMYAIGAVLGLVGAIKVLCAKNFPAA